MLRHLVVIGHMSQRGKCGSRDDGDSTCFINLNLFRKELHPLLPDRYCRKLFDDPCFAEHHRIQFGFHIPNNAAERYSSPAAGSRSYDRKPR